MSTRAGALTQPAILLLFCCEVQCFGVINHHFSTDGRKVTFPKVNLARVCHAHKLRCFLHCAQDAECRHVGVSAAGEVLFFDDPITPSPDESVTAGYLYSSRVSGLTTKERFSTNNDASAISPMSTSQQTLRTKENLSSSNSNSIQKRPASSSTATSHSRMTSTGKGEGKPDTRKSKVAKHPSIASTGTGEGKPDTRKSKVAKHPSIASTGTGEGKPDTRKSKVTKHPSIASAGTGEGKPDTRKSKVTKHPSIASAGTGEGKPDTRKSQVAMLTNSAITRQQNVITSDVHSRHEDPITTKAETTTTSPRPTTAGKAFIRGIYTIVTQTGTERDSGTDCFVHLDIYGQQGLWEALYLDNKGVDEMAKGAKDTFKFTRFTDLGNITKMILRIAEYGIEPGWLLIGVEVRRTRNYERHTITETFYTYINKWFQRMDGWHFFNREDEKYELPYKLVSTVTTEQ